MKYLLLTALSLALALPSFADEYRVTLAVYPGDDVNVVAADVAATYGARVIAAGESEFVTLDVPSSRESLLRNDPRVARLERIGVAPTASAALVPPTDAYATPWTLGNYAYDGGGNITAVGTTSFSYDGASRVLSGGSGDGHVQSYTYDGFGNILTITTDGGLESVGVNWATNQASVTSANIFGTYDTAGRVETYLNSDHFTYDGLDSIKESTLANVRRAYLYTASDERIAVIGLDQYGTEGSSEWTIRTPSHQVLRRFTKSAGLWKWKEDYVYAGSRLLAADTDTSASRTFFHLDHLGTPRLITGNGGNKIALHNYFAFGEESSSVLQDAEARKFTGHERDAVNLDYMHARYYNATWGRFLSVDPGGYFAHRPQSWNRYAYVENNPVSKVDPDGRELLGAAVGAYIGFVGGAIAEVHSQGWGWNAPINYAKVRHSAVGGATAGAITGACTCPVALGGAIGGVAGGLVTRKLNNEQTSPTQTAVAVVLDAAGGAVGAVAGKAVGGKLAANSTEALSNRAAALRAESLANNAGLGADKAVQQQIKAATVVGQQTGDAIAGTAIGLVQSTLQRFMDDLPHEPRP